MKLRNIFCCTFIGCLVMAAQNAPSEIPHLRSRDSHPTDRRRPAVPGLGGRIDQQQRHQRRVHEAHMGQAGEAKLNTVLATVAWNQVEPQEGKFDFSVVDGIIRDARSHNLRLVLLWFASWKNSLSSYPPTGSRKTSSGFPRAQVAGVRASNCSARSAMPTGRRRPRLRGP